MREREIDVLDAGGRLIRSFRRRIERPLIESDVIEQYRAARLASITDENARRSTDRSLAATQFPGRLPPYGLFRVDDQGQLWVQDYPLPARDSVTWTIFEASGRIIGRITLPPRLVIYQSGADFVLAKAQDELDVERVVLFPLARAQQR